VIPAFLASSNRFDSEMEYRFRVWNSLAVSLYWTVLTVEYLLLVAARGIGSRLRLDEHDYAGEDDAARQK
jgi:hypothetical protein